MAEPTNRIKALREEKSMTQVRLSIELEVTQETISAYEIGKHYPSAKSLIRMAELFEASIDYIMGLSPVRKMLSEKGLSEDETKLILFYRKLNKTKKEKVISYMQGLSDDN